MKMSNLHKLKATPVVYYSQQLKQAKNFIIDGYPDRMFSTEKEALNKINVLRSKRN